MLITIKTERVKAFQRSPSKVGIVQRFLKVIKLNIFSVSDSEFLAFLLIHCKKAINEQPLLLETA